MPLAAPESTILKRVVLTLDDRVRLWGGGGGGCSSSSGRPSCRRSRAISASRSRSCVLKRSTTSRMATRDASCCALVGSISHLA